MSHDAAKPNESEPRHRIFDLAEALPADLDQLDFSSLSKIEIIIPLPSFGSSNSYIDICSDLLDAAWIVERLALHADVIRVLEGGNSYSAILHSPRPSVLGALEEAFLLVCEDLEDDHTVSLRIQDIRSEVWDFQDRLDTYRFRVSEIIDHYWANMQSAYHELRSEAPDLYREHMERFPERRLGFHRSAESLKLQASVFASRDSWLLSREIDLNSFFYSNGQDYQLGDFVSGEVVTVGAHVLAIAAELVIEFPNAAYFRSRVCSGIALRDEDGLPELDLFADEGPLVSPYGRTPGQEYPPFGELCLIHKTGTMIIVGTSDWWHLLYDAQPLPEAIVRKLMEQSADLTEKLMASIGLSGNLTCPWDTMDDDAFETLCYDLIFSNPKFDRESIKRMGKSRARDGGRDIEVREAPGRPGVAARKWIFQCKLVKGDASLGRGRVMDVGDMLDQYAAQGFGIMTSAIIDSGLYDKIESICTKRQVQQYHFSKLELERALARSPAIRRRYFPELYG
jgi:hypothetical protein